MQQQVCVGLIAAPELSAKIASDLMEKLPDVFSNWLDNDVSWKVEMVVDSLIGTAEDVDEILREATEHRKEKGWDYAICLTDLPIFFGKNIEAAETSLANRIGQVSIPAFGLLMRKRTKKVMIQVMGELYHRTGSNGYAVSEHRNADSKMFRQNTSETGLLRKQFPVSPVKRVESSAGNYREIDIHFIIMPKFNGHFRLLLGMTHANRPLRVMSSFKKVIAIAFTTGAFGLIFTTMWKLSDILSVSRLLLLTLFSIIGMVIWIIAAHHLWERSTTRAQRSIRRLYNRTTFLTLVTSVMTYYVVLFFLFMVAVAVFIPPDMFESLANLENEAGVMAYARLAWLSTSISTIAGAIGAGLENEDLVRDITYGYRQQRRYKEMQEHEDTV